MSRRPEEITDLATLQLEYRRALFTILGHTAFFVICCVVAVVARRLFKMPPALLTAAFVVALLLFGRDFLHFLGCRRRLRKLLETGQ